MFFGSPGSQIEIDRADSTWTWRDPRTIDSPRQSLPSTVNAWPIPSGPQGIQANRSSRRWTSLKRDQPQGRDFEVSRRISALIAAMRLEAFTLHSALLGTATAAAAAFNSQAQTQAQAIDRDVVILGGGATGTYAAVQLREQGHTVALVEQKSRLGGHAETLFLPDGKYVNYGVEGYFNNEVTKDFFAQLDVDYEALLPATLLTQHVNFRTGERALPGSELLTTAAAALLYRGAIEQFDFLAAGVIDLPSEVPEILLRPFREFVDEYALWGAVDLVFTFTENVGNILDRPTLYVIQDFGIPHIDALLDGGYIRPKNGVTVLFDKAANYIDPQNIFYDSAAIDTTRSEDSVEVLIENSKTGSQTLIRAKRLLVAFPPVLDKLYGFDLSADESSLFAKWTYMNYYAAVLTNTPVPDNFNILNTDPSNQPGALPTTPFNWALEYSGVPGYFMNKIVGEANLTEAEARALVIDDVKRMSEAGTFKMEDGEEPTIAAFASHAPETLMVSTEDVAGAKEHVLYGVCVVHGLFDGVIVKGL
ncbi:uncharacterized protein DSM5745_05955 [Aspergillus mulundensis]|uniref:Amine oxidase domain-containing protein n=1 Tax=Aspergillus mulundensis TaxID=1810919 RepID=A0A3D8RYG4_9EURO|nr:hypothetical protein DSM5745_05955 [Aspergillus mulundensis]RDW79103.1 hypothetical protein DSM5745_05955 [Aspergillus mulundensis]